MGTSSLKIFVLLAMRNVIGLMAITADIYPKDLTIAYNQCATFSCTASNVADITFVVTGVDPPMWASRGISQSASTYSGSYTTTTLTVLGIKANNDLQITCRVYLGATYQDILPSAVLTVKGPTTSTSSSSQVSPTTTPSLTTTLSLTTTHSTSTPAPSLVVSTSTSALEMVVGVVGGMNAAALLVLVVVAIMYMICMYMYKRSRNKITTNGIPLSPDGKGEKGTSDTAIQMECSESTNDNSLQIISLQTTPQHSSIPPSSAVHSDDDSTSVPTSEVCVGHDDERTSPYPLSTEAAPPEETETATCRHDDTTYTPLPAALTHMPSGDGVVVGMLTTSSQKEGSESKPSSDANVESETIIISSTTLKHRSTQPSSAVRRNTSAPTSEDVPLAQVAPVLPNLEQLLHFTGNTRTFNMAACSKMGVFLLNDDTGTFVQDLEHKHRGNAEKIYMAIFSRWLQGNGAQPVTWSTLIGVLRKIGQGELADDIERGL